MSWSRDKKIVGSNALCNNIDANLLLRALVNAEDYTDFIRLTNGDDAFNKKYFLSSNRYSLSELLLYQNLICKSLNISLNSEYKISLQGLHYCLNEQGLTLTETLYFYLGYFFNTRLTVPPSVDFKEVDYVYTYTQFIIIDCMRKNKNVKCCLHAFETLVKEWDCNQELAMRFVCSHDMTVRTNSPLQHAFCAYFDNKFYYDGEGREGLAKHLGLSDPASNTKSGKNTAGKQLSKRLYDEEFRRHKNKVLEYFNHQGNLVSSSVDEKRTVITTGREGRNTMYRRRDGRPFYWLMKDMKHNKAISKQAQLSSVARNFRDYCESLRLPTDRYFRDNKELREYCLSRGLTEFQFTMVRKLQVNQCRGWTTDSLIDYVKSNYSDN